MDPSMFSQHNHRPNASQIESMINAEVERRLEFARKLSNATNQKPQQKSIVEMMASRMCPEGNVVNSAAHGQAAT